MLTKKENLGSEDLYSPYYPGLYGAILKDTNVPPGGDPVDFSDPKNSMYIVVL